MGIKLIFESKLIMVEKVQFTLPDYERSIFRNVNIRDPSHDENLLIMSVTWSINQNVFKYICFFLFYSHCVMRHESDCTRHATLALICIYLRKMISTTTLKLSTVMITYRFYSMLVRNIISLNVYHYTWFLCLN